MKEPHQKLHIMQKFYEGKVDYLDGAFTAKQTLRGLRPLLEMRFLTYTRDGQHIMRRDLNKLIQDPSSITSDPQGALLQFNKMLRNARFEAGHNRFISSIPGITIDELDALVSELVRKMVKTTEKSFPLIPEMLQNIDPDRRHLNPEAHRLDKFLMPVPYFVQTYTNDGVFYHGTPNIDNVLNMIRNGLAPSMNKSLIKGGQGTAAYGDGVYSTNNYIIAAGYGVDGVVLDLRLKNSPNLRILDLSRLPANIRAEIEGKFQGEDINRILGEVYNIDIIINMHILIQNRGAVKLPVKKTSDLIRIQIEKAQQSMRSHKDGDHITEELINQWFESLHPEGKFKNFARLLGIDVSDSVRQNLNKKLIQYFNQDHSFNELTFKLLFKFSDIRENSESDQEVYNAALNSFKRYYQSLGVELSKPEQTANAILQLKNAGIDILEYDLKDLIQLFGNFQNPEETANAIREIKNAHVYTNLSELLELLKNRGK